MAQLPAVALLFALAATGPAPADEGGAVTFSRDVAPILFDRCAGCHRPGEVAPFALLGYRDAAKRAGLIAEVTTRREMPPWKAEPGAGHFADERRLADAEIATLRRWADAGAPEGDPAATPPAPKFTQGWQLGEPDLVVRMPEPYALKAAGDDEYRCFVLPLGIPAGAFIRSIEYRPGNRRIVHHAVLNSIGHEEAAARLAAGDGKSFPSGLAPPGKLLSGPLSICTPGISPHFLPDDLVAAWPAGSDLVLQLHLHPSGTPETEQSTVGIYLTDRPPAARLQLSVLSNNRIDIPPDAAAYERRASRTLNAETTLFGVFPHMHLIGRSIAANPANPSHPPRRVTFGERTADEMAFLVFDVITPGPLPVDRAPTAEQLARHAAAAIRMLDKDNDGLLTESEVAASPLGRAAGADLSRRLADADKDRDGKLNAAELADALQAPRP